MVIRCRFLRRYVSELGLATASIGLRPAPGKLKLREEGLTRNSTEWRMSVATFSRVFRRLIGRARSEDKGLTLPRLRHHFVSPPVKAGVDVATIADLMGHSNISTTSVYLHSDSGAKREAIN